MTGTGVGDVVNGRLPGTAFLGGRAMPYISASVSCEPARPQDRPVVEHLFETQRVGIRTALTTSSVSSQARPVVGHLALDPRERRPDVCHRQVVSSPILTQLVTQGRCVRVRDIWDDVDSAEGHAMPAGHLHDLRHRRTGREQSCHVSGKAVVGRTDGYLQDPSRPGWHPNRVGYAARQELDSARAASLPTVADQKLDLALDRWRHQTTPRTASG
jgi:hypothetical protein